MKIHVNFVIIGVLIIGSVIHCSKANKYIGLWRSMEDPPSIARISKNGKEYIWEWQSGRMKGAKLKGAIGDTENDTDVLFLETYGGTANVYYKSETDSLSAGFSMGYVKYVRVTEPSIALTKGPDLATKQQSTPTTNQTKIVSVGGSVLTMRESPDIKGKALYSIPDKTIVTIIEETGSDVEISGVKGKWTKVAIANREGWVFGGFLR